MSFQADTSLGLNVFIFEDEDDILNQLEERFKSIGWKVCVSSSPEIDLDMLLRNGVVAVVLDRRWGEETTHGLFGSFTGDRHFLKLCARFDFIGIVFHSAFNPRSSFDTTQMQVNGRSVTCVSKSERQFEYSPAELVPVACFLDLILQHIRRIRDSGQGSDVRQAVRSIKDTVFPLFDNAHFVDRDPVHSPICCEIVRIFPGGLQLSMLEPGKICSFSIPEELEQQERFYWCSSYTAEAPVPNDSPFRIVVAFHTQEAVAAHSSIRMKRVAGYVVMSTSSKMPFRHLLTHIAFSLADLMSTALATESALMESLVREGHGTWRGALARFSDRLNHGISEAKTNLGNAVDELQSGFLPNLPSPRLAESVKAADRALAGAIDQIATLSASAPAPVAESVELVALVQSAGEETTDGLRKDASAGRIKIDWQRPNEQFIAELDASLVRKGLGSILASACKASAGRYGNPTQEVVVTLQVFSQSAVLKISDNGPPRSEDNLQWVFHRIGGWLESGSNRTTSVDLSCLGQHIVRAGGYVSAFVDSSKRTTFQIVFTSKSQIGYPVHGGATGS